MFVTPLLSVSTTACSDQTFLVEETIDTKAPLKLKRCEVLSEFLSRHPSLIIYICQWTATCAWTYSQYTSSVISMGTLLFPCIRIRTYPQRAQKNFMTGFVLQVSLSSNDLAKRFLHRHMQVKACIGKKCFTNRMIPPSYSSPSSGTRCMHGIRH